MNDKKVKKPNPESKPQELQDEQLEGAQGGLGYQLKNVQVTSFSTHGSGEDVAPDPKAKNFTSK